ncbi:hypothetical protein CsSME_00042214 [Camellia sinensis var. sinensis]
MGYDDVCNISYIRSVIWSCKIRSFEYNRNIFLLPHIFRSSSSSYFLSWYQSNKKHSSPKTVIAMSEVTSGTTSTPAAAILVKTSNSHSVQITTIRLNGDNFLRWSQSVRMYIRGQGKIGYITGDKKAPAVNDPLFDNWDAENSMVMTWLVNSMEEDISSNYMCYTTAQELWDNVSQMYSDLGNQSQVFELTLKLGEIRQGDDSVTKYFNSLKRLWQDLDIFNTYEWKSVDDCNHHKKTVEDSRIYKFLAGLNIEFDEVRGRIIGRPPLPSIGEVFAEVRREESRRSVMLKKKGNGESIEISALISDVAANKAANYQRRFDDKSRVWCDLLEFTINLPPLPPHLLH